MVFLAVLLVAYATTRLRPGTHRLEHDRWRQALAAGIDIDGQPGGIDPWIRLGFQPLFV